ncbi:uncharacterized protein LOC101454492 [Ceratitis capitata]|uniref:(Mediterranean fruit fly) hypothetical protein n=1 Tax=Ceratitis capitata TaxID=7213 RepID=A0A811TZI6_CERCA|nr:uncharacterized protein LOC101454492 [Ceratitis capitata]CAD6991490.1 unnamed protein product [Ceratitis capitata]
MRICHGSRCGSKGIQRVLLLLLFLQSLNAALATLGPPQALQERKAAEKVLSRKRRYVAFPDGSSLSASICLTIGVIGNPIVEYLSWAENWGVAYDLPNYAWVKEHTRGFKKDKDENKTKAMAMRRSRRDLFGKLETLIENMGFNGNACIARALCESSKYLQDARQGRGNMMTEIIKTIFSLPTEPVFGEEPDVMHHYDRIYKRARRDVLDCSVEHAQCHFSLLEMAFGKYSIAPKRQSPQLLANMPEGRGFM